MNEIKKGQTDWHIPLNENFGELENETAKVTTENTFKGTQTIASGELIVSGGVVKLGNTMKISNTRLNEAYFYPSTTDANGLFLGYVENIDTLCPVYNNGLTLGAPNHKWKGGYFATAPVVTSDKNLKKDIENLEDDFVIAMVENLRPVQYQMKDGDSGRTHIGFIAQEIEEVLTLIGKKDTDFAGFIRSPKTEEYIELDEQGNEISKTREVEGEYIYGLRYEEFIALLYKYAQIKEQQRNEEQQDTALQIQKLVARIETLENQLKGESK